MGTLHKIALSFFLFCLAPLAVSAATLSVSPASGSFHVGDKVVVRIVTSTNTPINAVSGVVSFPSDLFSVDSVSKSGSILNFWVTEPSASGGSLQFEGVALGGFAGGTGTVFTATLRAVKAGSGKLSFVSGQVLANDGQGTNVTDGLSGAVYTIEEAPITIPTLTPVITPTKETVPMPVVEKPIQTSTTATTTTEMPQPKPTLTSPEISLGSRYGAQAISGMSGYPKAQVLVTFISDTGVKIFITGNTDHSGGFVLPVPQSLKHGAYTVSAVVIGPDTSSSFASNEITISIGSIFSDTGWKALVAIGLLIIALMYLIVRTAAHVRKSRKLEKTVHNSFKILREDAGDTRQIKKDLDDAETLINKEIKDIERS